VVAVVVVFAAVHIPAVSILQIPAAKAVLRKDQTVLEAVRLVLQEALEPAEKRAQALEHFHVLDCSLAQQQEQAPEPVHRRCNNRLPLLPVLPLAGVVHFFLMAVRYQHLLNLNANHSVHRRKFFRIVFRPIRPDRMFQCSAALSSLYRAPFDRHRCRSKASEHPAPSFEQPLHKRRFRQCP
jgi:hypothetical protein